MTLTSLRSAAGLATNALDTARSTFKAMADAAVPTGGAPTAEAAEAAAPAAAAESPAPGARKGRRVGVALDEYA